MLDLIAWCARKIEGGLMRLHIRGQRLVTYSELKQMFGCDYPDDVWALFANTPEGATRADVIERLRVIANRNQRGAMFAVAAAR